MTDPADELMTCPRTLLGRWATDDLRFTTEV